MNTARTRLLAVIGDPIEHSMSPLIHGAALAHARLDFAYVAFRVQDAAAAIEAMRRLGIRGYSVTIPHKESVVSHLDRLDASVERCRSCNTVVNDDGFLAGYSTDGPGAVMALRNAGCDPRGLDALIVGSGGAARAIAFALLDASVRSLRFRAVEIDQAALLARDLDAARPGIVSALEPDAHERAQLLVNASPIGMHPAQDAMPVPLDWLRKDLAVFDVVYNPLTTKLVAAARERGCLTIDGVGMFAEQAALQFELFTGEKAPRDVMRRVVRDALARAEAR
ncbi:MAG: shikimate dehydrogenase [Vicinamibacteria bacterium]|nr:shikimate dehydrogenase [Vicinamibacteria bacterium]